MNIYLNSNIAPAALRLEPAPAKEMSALARPPQAPGVPAVSTLADAASDVSDVLRTFSSEIEAGNGDHRGSMSKIVGITLSSVAAGIGTGAAASVLAGGVTVASLGGAALIGAAALGAGYAAYRYAPEVVNSIDAAARALGGSMRNAWDWARSWVN